nr:hypothetical protein [Candidatus Dependentiae bacterium]
MKLKPLVILTIICLCLGIYIFLVDKNKKSTDEILQSDQSIIPFSKNAVTEISINSITFSRKQGTDEWTITEPVKSDVDNEYFQFFLSRIFDMKFIQKQKISEQELSQFEINVKNKLNMINSVTG